jgi:acylphosphatase
MDRNKTGQGPMVRAKLVISGWVQGVYFRASARDVAYAQRLSGWVRNRMDGTVEAVVEGEKAAVQAFIAWCQNGPPGAEVTEVQVTMESYADEYQGFRIVG